MIKSITFLDECISGADHEMDVSSSDVHYKRLGKLFDVALDSNTSHGINQYIINTFNCFFANKMNSTSIIKF